MAEMEEYLSESEIEALEQKAIVARHKQVTAGLEQLQVPLKELIRVVASQTMPDNSSLIAETNKLLSKVAEKADLSKSDMAELKNHISEASRKDADRIIAALENRPSSFSVKSPYTNVTYTIVANKERGN
jgi:endonuclease III